MVRKAKAFIVVDVMAAILLAALKIGRVVDWSWWWVVAPIWLPPLLFFIAFLVAIAVVFAAGISQPHYEDDQRF